MKKSFSQKFIPYFTLSCTIGGFIVYCIIEIGFIHRNPSSTAVLGIFNIPFIGGLVALVSGIFGYCLGYVIQHKGKDWHSWRFLVAAFIVISFLFFVADTYIKISELKVSINAIATFNPQQLAEKTAQLIADGPSRFRPFLFSAIARNDQTNAQTLAKIANIKDTQLYNSLYDHWESIFDILGNDTRVRRGIAVMRVVVSHPNVTPQILTQLATSTQDYYVLLDIAQNPKTPSAILIKLGNTNDRLLLMNLADNPNTPANLRNQVTSKLKNCGEPWQTQCNTHR